MVYEVKTLLRGLPLRTSGKGFGAKGLRLPGHLRSYTYADKATFLRTATMDQSKATYISPKIDAKGMKFALVVSRFNSLVTKELLAGALDVIVRHGGREEDQTVIWAPGGFEIPLLAKAALERGGLDGVIALGCVMKGETTHNDFIMSEAAKGCASLSLQYNKPVSFGILSPETLEQALQRAGLKMGNKGAEAALAAIEVVATQKLLGKR